jgi:hypothetical protein
MILLKDLDSGIVSITEEQLKFLQDQLEEESPRDRDYYLNAATLDAFEADGADPALMAMLRGALGTREDMEIGWSRDDPAPAGG